MCRSAPLERPLPSLLEMKATRMPTIVLPAPDRSSVMYLTCENSSIAVVSGLVKDYVALYLFSQKKIMYVLHTIRNVCLGLSDLFV